MNQTELRELLDEKARAFSLDERIPSEIRRRARRRVVLSRIGAGLTTAVLLLGGGVLVTQAGRSTPTPPITKVPVAIDLVDYYDDDDDESGSSRSELDRHVSCMREQGFDLPDPTRTDDGWSILVADPDSLGFNTPEWREAAFVDCRPSPPPGPGDLIFGFDILSQSGTDAFRSCMADEGFGLPPARAGDNEWRFDLSDSTIDLGDEGWSRAVFVTCWPGRWD